MEAEENNALLALADVLGGNRYTTAEARELARKGYNSYLDTAANLDVQEEDYYDRLERNAEEAKKVISNARQFVAERRYKNGRLPFLELAGALGKPTKSGSFGEGLGYVTDALADHEKGRMQFEDEQQQSLTDIDQLLLNIDKDRLQGRLKGIHDRRGLESKHAIEHLKLLGREVRGSGSGGGGLSEAEKYVRGTTDLEPGDPGYNEAVAARQAYLDQVEREKAGVDIPEDEGDVAARAEQVGVPLLDRDPFAGYSTKNRQRRKENLEREAASRLDEVRSARESAIKTINDMETFRSLNEDQRNTGPVKGWFIRFLTSEGERMAGISSEQARNLRVPGEGPMSNYDATELKNATVSVLKRPASNAAVADAVIAAKKQQVDYAKYLNDYYSVYGHLDGADKAWIEYVEANPILDPKQPGKLVKNKNRVPYDVYFRLKNFRLQDPESTAGKTDAELLPFVTPITEEGIEVPGFAGGGPVRGPLRESPNLHSRLDEIARAVFQGATLNWGDEMLSGGDPDALARERAILENYHNESPIESIIAETVGALPASAAAVYGGSRVLDRLGKSSGRVGRVAGAASRLVPKSTTGRMIGSGAVAGGVAGAGASQDEEQLGVDVALGTTLGAAFAPLAGIMSKYGVRSVNGLIDLISRNKVDPADKKIIEALLKDRVDLPAEAARIAGENARGVPSTLGDIEGRNLQGLRTFVAKQSSPGAEEMVTNVANRAAGTGTRAIDRINKEFQPSPYFSQLEKLRTDLYTQADPLYKQAWADNPAVKSKYFNELMENKDGMKAIKQAMRIMRGEGSHFGTVDALGNLRRPSLEMMDRTRRVLRDLSEGAKEGGKPTEMSRYYRQMADRLEAEMQNPEIVKGDALQRARAQYKGDQEVIEALEMGRDNFMRMSKDELEQATKGMSKAEKDALRTGVAHAIFDAIEGVKDTADPVQKIVGTEKMRSKLNMLFDDPKQAEEFIKDLSRESSIFQRDKRLLGAAERARGRELEGGSGADLQDAALAGGAAMLAQGVTPFRSPYWMARIGNTLSRAARMTSDKTVDGVAKRLGEKDPLNIQMSADVLNKELQRLSRRLRAESDAALSGALAGSRFGTSPPYGYLSGEEDDGYAVGGPVRRRRGYAEGGQATVGMSSPKPSPLDYVITGSSPSPTGSYTGTPGTTFGTGDTRSRATLPVDIDWTRYGEGPEVSFFDNNRVPDAVYTTTPADTGYKSATSSGATKSGVLGAVGTAAGLLSKGKKVMDIAQKIPGLRDLLPGAAGAGSSSLAGLGALEIAPNALSTLPTSLGGTAAGAGTTAASGTASAGTAGAGLAPGAGAGVAQVAVPAAIAYAASKVIPQFVNSFKKDPAYVQGNYDPETGQLQVGFNDWTNQYMDQFGITPDEILGRLTPVLDQYVSATTAGEKWGDKEMLNWAMEQGLITRPENYIGAKDRIYKQKSRKAYDKWQQSASKDEALDHLLYQLMAENNGLWFGKGDIMHALKQAHGLE